MRATFTKEGGTRYLYGALDVHDDRLIGRLRPRREWADKANVELVPTPTYASYLNRIECHFWAIGEFVSKNADHDSWEQLALAMAATSGTATAPTATDDSPNWNGESASPKRFRVQRSWTGH